MKESNMLYILDEITKEKEKLEKFADKIFVSDYEE